MVNSIPTSKDDQGTTSIANQEVQNIFVGFKFPRCCNVLSLSCPGQESGVASLGIFFATTLLSPQQVQPCQIKDDVYPAAKTPLHTALDRACL